MTTDRDKILEVAVTAFARKGYDGCSVRTIANGAAVNVAMIGYYFGSKRGLFQAVLKHFEDELTERLLWADRTAGPGEAAAASRQRTYWVFTLVELPAYFHVLTSHAAMADEDFPGRACRDALLRHRESAGIEPAAFGRVAAEALLSPAPLMDWSERRRRALADDLAGITRESPSTRPQPTPAPPDEPDPTPVQQGGEFLDGFID